MEAVIVVATLVAFGWLVIKIDEARSAWKASRIARTSLTDESLAAVISEWQPEPPEATGA